MKTSAIVLQVSVNFFLRKCSIGFVFIFGFRCDPLYPVFQRFTPDFCPHGFETLAFGLARCICSRGVIYKVIRGGSARVSVFNFRSSRGWLKICLSLRVHVCVCVIVLLGDDSRLLLRCFVWWFNCRGIAFFVSSLKQALQRQRNIQARHSLGRWRLVVLPMRLLFMSIHYMNEKPSGRRERVNTTFASVMSITHCNHTRRRMVVCLNHVPNQIAMASHI